MPTPAVDIQNIRKDYAKLQALKGISLAIPQGSFFGLLGPNGAGKSTLINIMAGLVRPSGGSIKVLGHDVLEDWRQARHSLGIVPQELVYDPFFNVREMLRLQSGYFGFGKENHAWVDELIEILNLTDKANTNLQSLSGGMKRRVLIAQALVHKPPVVVLDEPTAGVDVELRQSLWEFTKRLHAQGHTILLTTHYLEEAEALCDRIAILNKGEIVALDDTAALLSRHPYRFLNLHLSKTDIQLPAALQSKVVSLDKQKLRLRLHREQDSIVQVLDSLHAAQIGFDDLHTDDPGLEEVFMDLIQQPQKSGKI